MFSLITDIVSPIDRFLNSITMYRLVLYGTQILAVLGIIFSFLGWLPLNGWQLLISFFILNIVTYITNGLFSYLWDIPVSEESGYITAAILFLILPPPATVLAGSVIALAAITAIASKFILAYRGKLIFNPAALGVVVISLTGLGYASWWIGSAIMLAPVAILGLLFARKTRRMDFVVTFLIVAIIAFIIANYGSGVSIPDLVQLILLSFPLVFFGSVMLSEPTTTPPTRGDRILYGLIVGILFGNTFGFGPFQSSPQVALLIGNVFAFIVSPKLRLTLRLKERVQMAPQVYDFIFTPDRQLNFTAGQYLAWTFVGMPKNDLRGNRRFFTIASSPTEPEIHLGVKIPAEKPSTYKQALLLMQPGDPMYAGQLSGDFLLPDNLNKPLVAIAGGIGITPFRSMIKYLTDTKQKIDMVLFYVSADPAEFVYKEVLAAGENVGIKTVYVLSGAKVTPPDWKGKTGYITAEMLQSETSNYADRTYYLSGPPPMVDAYKKLLYSLNISHTAIHTDYFPGY